MCPVNEEYHKWKTHAPLGLASSEESAGRLAARGRSLLRPEYPLFYTMLSYNTLHYIRLHYTTLYCIRLTTLYYTILHKTHYTTLIFFYCMTVFVIEL